MKRRNGALILQNVLLGLMFAVLVLLVLLVGVKSSDVGGSDERGIGRGG